MDTKLTVEKEESSFWEDKKQRIVLARAILKNPSVLLLDEATSVLDIVSENLVQEAPKKVMVGRTCVVVAHCLSIVHKTDCIVDMVIKNGKVVEKGTHSQLLDIGTCGSYYSLIKLQHGRSRLFLSLMLKLI